MHPVSSPAYQTVVDTFHTTLHLIFKMTEPFGFYLYVHIGCPLSVQNPEFVLPPQ